MKTWTEIRKAADEAGFFHGWIGAEENAGETTNDWQGAEFDRIALATLQEYLAYGNLDAAEHAFFVKLGVEF